MPDPIKNTYLTIKHNDDGSKTVTNAICVEADELIKAYDPQNGIWIGWTCDTKGEWSAPVKPETKEEETND